MCGLAGQVDASVIDLRAVKNVSRFTSEKDAEREAGVEAGARASTPRIWTRRRAEKKRRFSHRDAGKRDRQREKEKNKEKRAGMRHSSVIHVRAWIHADFFFRAEGWPCQPFKLSIVSSSLFLFPRLDFLISSRSSCLFMLLIFSRLGRLRVFFPLLLHHLPGFFSLTNWHNMSSPSTHWNSSRASNETLLLVSPSLTNSLLFNSFVFGLKQFFTILSFYSPTIDTLGWDRLPLIERDNITNSTVTWLAIRRFWKNGWTNLVIVRWYFPLFVSNR